MDFRHQVSPPDAWATLACDALLVVTTADAADRSLPAPLAALLKDAIANGDLAAKTGKALYLHRPAGLKTTRLVFAVAGSASAKAFKAALALGLGLVKGTGAKHLAVAFAGQGVWAAEHAEAAVAAVGDATYVYRHTKPSAPAAAALAKVSLLCSPADAKAVALGVARGEAIAAGVALAKECANRPGEPLHAHLAR